MNLLQRYSKLKKYKQVPDLSGNRYLEHIDYIIKASTPVKGKDYFDGAKGDKGESIKGDKGDVGEKGESIKGQDGYTPVLNKDYFNGEKGERGSKFLGKVKTQNELADFCKALGWTQDNALTKNKFFNQEILSYIRKVVKNYRVQKVEERQSTERKASLKAMEDTNKAEVISVIASEDSLPIVVV